LQHERSVAEQAFVLLAPVSALAPEQLLVPAAALGNVCDRDQSCGRIDGTDLLDRG
jgi:hypothetical protein